VEGALRRAARKARCGVDAEGVHRVTKKPLIDAERRVVEGAQAGERPVGKVEVGLLEEDPGALPVEGTRAYRNFS
jgi:hypothetical protein